MCSAQYGCLCRFLISCFPTVCCSGIVRVILKWSQSPPITTGITFAFKFHMRWICVVRSLYSKIFSVSYLITFLCPGIATSINTHVPLFQLFLFKNMIHTAKQEFLLWYHHHHHHHKHQGLDPLIYSVSTVTAAHANASSVFQLFSFLVVCSGMISKGFSFVAFFASVKASSVCIHLSCLVCP